MKRFRRSIVRPAARAARNRPDPQADLPDTQLALGDSLESGVAHGNDSSNPSHSTPVDDMLAEIDTRIEALKNAKRAAGKVHKLLSAASDLDLASLEQAEHGLSLALSERTLAALLPLAVQLATEAKLRLASLKSERADVRRRREDFARLADRKGWHTSHTGATDHVGPFTLHHTEDATTILYGSVRITTLNYPSPSLIANAIEAHEHRLNTDAHHNFEEFLAAAAREQDKLSKTEAVQWPQIIEAVIPNAAQRKRMKRVLLWRLGLLLSARAPGGWQIETVPPNLQEMPRAWSVPRLDRPNDTLRVFRVRLIRGARSASCPDAQKDIPGGCGTRQPSES